MLVEMADADGVMCSNYMLQMRRIFVCAYPETV